MYNDTNNTNAVKLPLWKHVVEIMLDTGCTYGNVYELAFFEEHLRMKREQDTMRFDLSIAHIRRALEYKGFFLSGRGSKGTQWVILPPEANASQMQAYQRQACDVMRRTVILGSNTDTSRLNDEQKRRHEHILEKAAARAALLSRRNPAKLLVP